MCDLDSKLKKLVADASALPQSSPRRQRLVQELHYWVTTSNKLWRDSALYYSDALQDMWVYCCENLDEYDPSTAGVITWLNKHLKRLLQNHSYRQTRDRKRHLSTPENSEGQRLDPVDMIPSRTDTSPLLAMMERTLEWIRTDPDGILRMTCFRQRTDVNARALFLLRIPDKIPWQTIATQFSLNPAESKDLPKFYNRRCLPLLRNFGKAQGYIDDH